MMPLSSACTIKAPQGAIIHVEPTLNPVGYLIQVMDEETGEIYFQGHFGCQVHDDLVR